MDHSRTIVLYGASVGLTAIGAGLAERPGLHVIPMDSVSPPASWRLRQLHPDVILFDLAAAQPEAAISLLAEFPKLLIIGVDLVSHQALVLSDEQPKLLTIDDFVRLIDTQPLAASGGSQ